MNERIASTCMWRGMLRLTPSFWSDKSENYNSRIRTGREDWYLVIIIEA